MSTTYTSPTGPSALTSNPQPGHLSSNVIGACFLAAFVFYGGGSALVDSVTQTSDAASALADQAGRVRLGVLMILANSLVVVTIGALAHPVVGKTRPAVANGYLAVRILEATFLAIGGVFVLLAARTAEESEAQLINTLIEANNVAYAVGLLALAAGSIPFFWVVAAEGSVPRPLGIALVVGYLLLAVGMLVELLELGSGVIFAIPGGLVEFAFGIWLIVRGFDASKTSAI